MNTRSPIWRTASAWSTLPKGRQSFLKAGEAARLTDLTYTILPTAANAYRHSAAGSQTTVTPTGT